MASLGVSQTMTFDMTYFYITAVNDESKLFKVEGGYKKLLFRFLDKFPMASCNSHHSLLNDRKWMLSITEQDIQTISGNWPHKKLAHKHTFVKNIAFWAITIMSMNCKSLLNLKYDVINQNVENDKNMRIKNKKIYSWEILEQVFYKTFILRWKKYIFF